MHLCTTADSTIVFRFLVLLWSWMKILSSDKRKTILINNNKLELNITFQGSYVCMSVEPSISLLVLILEHVRWQISTRCVISQCLVWQCIPLIPKRCISSIIEITIRNLKITQKIPNIGIRPLQDRVDPHESRPIRITRRKTSLSVRKRISSPKTNKDSNNCGVLFFQMLQSSLHSSANCFQF